jgi:hypothetical protein
VLGLGWLGAFAVVLTAVGLVGYGLVVPQRAEEEWRGPAVVPYRRPSAGRRGAAPQQADEEMEPLRHAYARLTGRAA